MCVCVRACVFEYLSVCDLENSKTKLPSSNVDCRATEKYIKNATIIFINDKSTQGCQILLVG